MSDRDKTTNVTVNFGLVTNILLSIVKTAVGIFGHSQALLADGINSTSDVVYYVAVKIFMHKAKQPADKEHPYGHRQLESIASIVVGAFILTTGIAIFWQSINKVIELVTNYDDIERVPLAVLFIALGTLLMKIYLFIFTKKNHKKTNNPTLRALADDHFNDILAAAAVIVGVVMARFGLYWMDPAAGAVVAVFIAKTGISIILESSAELMDKIPEDGFRREVRDIALSITGVRQVELVGVHRFGPYFTIDMTICVDGNISVDEGNTISHNVEDKLLDHFHGGLRKVMIHYHPE
ncbi:MAG: cation diffusion facilitator family transporter [Candidatus Syntrophosphaera sp.]